MPYKDPEKARAYLREYKKRPEQRKKAAAAQRCRRAADPSKPRANEKAWREDNPEKVRAKNALGNKKYKRTIRDSNLKKLYGITHEDYVVMLEAQDGRCAICGVDKPRTRKKTGKVRGLLCDPCNNGIGRLNDDPALLRKAIEYLEKTG